MLRVRVFLHNGFLTALVVGIMISSSIVPTFPCFATVKDTLCEALKPHSTSALADALKKILTLFWYHGVNMTPGLFDRLNIPNFEIIFHLALYFLCRLLSTVSIHSILISMLPFL